MWLLERQTVPKPASHESMVQADTDTGPVVQYDSITMIVITLNNRKPVENRPKYLGDVATREFTSG